MMLFWVVAQWRETGAKSWPWMDADVFMLLIGVHPRASAADLPDFGPLPCFVTKAVEWKRNGE